MRSELVKPYLVLILMVKIGHLTETGQMGTKIQLIKTMSIVIQLNQNFGFQNPNKTKTKNSSKESQRLTSSTLFSFLLFSTRFLIE